MQYLILKKDKKQLHNISYMNKKRKIRKTK